MQNLPFEAAFKYALYTHGYVMVSGYPHFDTAAAARSHLSAASRGALGGGLRCPYETQALQVSDAEILADRHMATAFVSDAVLQCFLWALHREGKLRAEIRDGDIPNVRPLRLCLCSSTCLPLGRTVHTGLRELQTHQVQN